MWGQGNLTCCSPWGHKGSGPQLSNWTTSAAMVDTHVYSFVARVSHWVKFIMPDWESFPGSYSGSCIWSLRKPPHQYYPLVCLNYNNAGGSATVLPSGLFHSLTEYIWSLAVVGRCIRITQAESLLSFFRKFWI